MSQEHSATGNESDLAHPSWMTVGTFVEEKFAPEHIELMRYAGRNFYQSILKHVITPEEVDRIFRKNPSDPRKKLRALPDWPYLNDVRLCEICSNDISRLTESAVNRGYSVETVRHIRNVIGAIIAHAIREKHFIGENPVSLVKPLRRLCKEEESLTLDQARLALSLMRYPEKEFILIGTLARTSPSETIGLQWRQINMTGNDFAQDRSAIPAMTIAIRQRWYRGELDAVRRNSQRDVPITRPLLSILTELRSKSRFTAPGDFVLTSQLGTPVSHDNMMAQRLRPIAKRLGVSAISSQAFRRVRFELADHVGAQLRIESETCKQAEGGFETESMAS
jgi:integrase